MYRRCRPLLGTFVEVTLPEACSGVADAAFAEIERIHRLMSFHEAGSDLARLHRAPAGAVVELDPCTVEVLAEAQRLHLASGGLFDVTIGRQMVEGGFLPGEAAGELAAYDGAMGDLVIFDEGSVWLTRKVLVDLGGIAKGYAVDRAVEALQARGVVEGCVNAGGDLRVFGAAEWQVALREGGGDTRHTILVWKCAVASSENRASRRVARGSLRTPHIGRGKRSILADERVTVIAESCMRADAMTKIAMADRELAALLLGDEGIILPGPAQLAECA